MPSRHTDAEVSSQDDSIARMIIDKWLNNLDAKVITQPHQFINQMIIYCESLLPDPFWQL